MINGLITGHWDNWEELLESMGELALNESMNEVKSLALTELGDPLFNSLNIPPESAVLLPAVREILSGFIQDGFDGIKPAMQRVKGQFVSHSPEQALIYVGDIFSEIESRINAGPVRDFILPVMHLIVRAAIQQSDLDDDQVIHILAFFFTQQIILQPHFSDHMAQELEDALSKAQTFVPNASNDPVYDRKLAMDADFELWRRGAEQSTNGFNSMNLINEDSWLNLARQSPVDDFTRVLSYISDTLLPVLQVSFTTLCTNLYPSTCSLQKDTQDFIAVLDAIGLMTKVIELTHKTIDLTELDDDMSMTNDVLLVED
jgi:hypothetical protein